MESFALGELLAAGFSPYCPHWSVFADRFHVNGRPYTCPPALREFVGLFDQGYACSPLTVEVRVERGAVRTEGGA